MIVLNTNGNWGEKRPTLQDTWASVSWAFRCLPSPQHENCLGIRGVDEEMQQNLGQTTRRPWMYVVARRCTWAGAEKKALKNWRKTTRGTSDDEQRCRALTHLSPQVRRLKSEQIGRRQRAEAAPERLLRYSLATLTDMYTRTRCRAMRWRITATSRSIWAGYLILV